MHDGIPNMKTSIPEFIMVFHVVPLSIVALEPALLLCDLELRRKCRELLVKLDAYVRSSRNALRSFIGFDPDFWQDGVRLEIVPATIAICKNIVTLGEAGALPLEDTGPDDLMALPFLNNLISAIQDLPQVEEGVLCLRNFRQSHFSPTTGPAPVDVVTLPVLNRTEDAAETHVHGEGEDDKKSQDDATSSTATSDVKV